MPRSLLLKAADRMIDHPGPSTTRRHARTMVVLVTVAVVGILTGRHLSH